MGQTYDEIIANYDPALNTTRNVMTKFEAVKLIGMRAEQLQRGSPPLVDFDAGSWDARKIAHMELQQKKLPLMLCRKLTDGSKEYWRVKDMVLMWDGYM